MSNNQQPLKTNVDDLRDVMEFWEMKDESESLFKLLASIARDAGYTAVAIRTSNFVSRIESLGKKEGK